MPVHRCKNQKFYGVVNWIKGINTAVSSRKPEVVLFIRDDIPHHSCSVKGMYCILPVKLILVLLRIKAIHAVMGTHPYSFPAVDKYTGNIVFTGSIRC